MAEATSAFDAHDLKDELRPPELTDDEQLWVRDDAPTTDEGLPPQPSLDPLHGRVRVVNDYTVQVFTAEDIYHELVEWLDEVFDIPRGYEVYWVDLRSREKTPNFEPHALIILRDDDEVYEHSEDAGPQVFHEYTRDGHSGEGLNGWRWWVVGEDDDFQLDGLRP